LPQDTSSRVERLLGSPVVSLERVVGRGYTLAGRFVVALADGRRVFAKEAVDADTGAWLRTEHVVYSQVEGSFLPRLLAWEDAEHPLLVLEDLSDGQWPPPWTDDMIAAVLTGLRRIAATAPPHGVPSIEAMRLELTDGWARVAADPEAFLSLGLCTRPWLEAGLPRLREAAEHASIEGEALLHLDVRSDNICIRDGRACLVDWNWACVGNPEFDFAAWLPSLHVEGGPAPETFVVHGAEGFAALLAGFWAARAGLPPPPTADPRVRDGQRAQLEVALEWAVQTLGLPLP
jgi:hypothetical protein